MSSRSDATTGQMVRQVCAPVKPLVLYRSLRLKEPGCALFDSFSASASGGRWGLVLMPSGQPLKLTSNTADAQQEVADFLSANSCLKVPLKPGGLTGPQGLPFYGGVFGMVSYEAARSWHLPGLPSHPSSRPEVFLCASDVAYIFDYHKHQGWLIGTDPRIEATLESCAKAAGSDPLGPEEPEGLLSVQAPQGSKNGFVGQMGRSAYMAAVEQARAWIASGDIYQVNLAEQYLVKDPPEVDALLAVWGQHNPVPFGAVLPLGTSSVLLSASPERLFLVADGRICTQPIKGTRPRGQNVVDDCRYKKDLLCSAKERAELLMIVDMARNDLGRLCRFGSVHVQGLYDLDSYTGVHHLSAEVSGALRQGVDYMDAGNGADCTVGGLTPRPLYWQHRLHQLPRSRRLEHRHSYPGARGCPGEPSRRCGHCLGQSTGQ